MAYTMPTAIRNYNKDGRLEIDWDDGHHSVYSHEHLRVTCPCADCRGHTPDQAKVITGKENVRITSIEPVGHYALQIAFDDGHDTGLYEFSELRHGFCQCPEHTARESTGGGEP
ncbi:MAG TPA: DUF971 domain-containing protein [Mariprofundaceae bacterium]|nr:DUF971 domain-containing protein [Mariprofundaceae bacterium]